MKLRTILNEQLLSGDQDEKFYNILVNATNSGPFDGGCVIVAQVLQQVHGGEIVVLVNDKDQADHAAVQIGNSLMDYGGQLPVKDFIKRFEDNERVTITDVRPIEPNDLPDAPRDDKVISQLVALLIN